jgi:hypothetical protein
VRNSLLVEDSCADARGAGNLGLSATRTFTLFIATHVSIRTSDTSSKGHPSPSQAYGTLSYHLQAPLSALRLRHVCVAQDDSTLMGALPLVRFAQAASSSSRASALNGACRSAISVPSLSPVTSSAQDDSTSELLRFL